jgi:pimeloyl-ACP methyl ester carboxylesterase
VWCACDSSDPDLPDAAPDAGPPLDATVDDAGTDAGMPLAWGSCPTGFRDECATFQAPLNHADPDGETIDVFVSRRGSGTRQLWLLQGGPGASAESFFGLHDFLEMVDPDLEVYVIEHRGVGDSTRLGCSAEGTTSPAGLQITLDEWRGCHDELVAEWGDRLAFFDTTQAAHDLALAIERTRRPGQSVFLYGGSYGSYWANRFAVLHPDVAAGIVLDAPVQPGSRLHEYDLAFEPIGREVFGELCPASERCREHLGDDPAAFVDTLFEKLATGHCASLGVDVDTWKVVFGLSLMNYNLRNWLPAIAYRLDRCSTGDQSAIATLFNRIFGGGGPLRTSQPLQVNVVLSELWPREATDRARIDAAREEAVFFMDALAHLYETESYWPRYAEDPRGAEYAPARVPILAMAGTLDPAAPPARTAYGFRDNLRGPHQTFVEIPYGPHTVLSAGFLAEGPTCSVRLVRAFLADPTAELPVDCVPDVLPPSFDAPPTVSQTFFGSDDLYD